MTNSFSLMNKISIEIAMYKGWKDITQCFLSYHSMYLQTFYLLLPLVSSRRRDVLTRTTGQWFFLPVVSLLPSSLPPSFLPLSPVSLPLPPSLLPSLLPSFFLFQHLVFHFYSKTEIFQPNNRWINLFCKVHNEKYH